MTVLCLRNMQCDEKTNAVGSSARKRNQMGPAMFCVFVECNAMITLWLEAALEKTKVDACDDVLFLQRKQCDGNNAVESSAGNSKWEKVCMRRDFVGVVVIVKAGESDSSASGECGSRGCMVVRYLHLLGRVSAGLRRRWLRQCCQIESREREVVVNSTVKSRWLAKELLTAARP